MNFLKQGSRCCITCIVESITNIQTVFQGGVREKVYEILKLRGGAGPTRHEVPNPCDFK